MLAVYGIDVLDPRTSLRRIHVLLARLPAGSMPRVEHDYAWSLETHMLARLNDAVDALCWITLRVNGSKASRPKPIRRPSRQGPATQKPKLAWADLAGHLGGVADGR